MNRQKTIQKILNYNFNDFLEKDEMIESINVFEINDTKTFIVDLELYKNDDFYNINIKGEVISYDDQTFKILGKI